MATPIVLTGGGGNDAMNGGGGTGRGILPREFANYSFSLNGDGNVIVTDTRAGSPEGADTLGRLSDQRSTAKSASGAGTDAGATMTFIRVADLMLGFGGNDILNSGDGNDVLIGGAGDDALNGGPGTDTAVFSGPIANYGFSFNGRGTWSLPTTVPAARMGRIP